MARMLFLWKRGINKYRKALARHDIAFLELAYEDLFDPALTMEQRRESLDDVLLFLGRDPAAEGLNHERIDTLFDPARSKVNSADTYRLVPGIERIERLFGSRENGWLFKSGGESARHREPLPLSPEMLTFPNAGLTSGSPEDPMTDRFVLFSLPRCGSTTLMHLLNCHPDIRCTHEPFNYQKTELPICEPVKDSETLDLLIDSLWERYNGIKHMHVPIGWPFPNGSTLSQHLLVRPGQKVILLHRRNLLQQIVSNQMALQSSVYQIRNAEDRDRITEFRFMPISEKALAHMLDVWKRDNENYRNLLSRQGIAFLDLAYEDLFGPALTMKHKRKALEEIFVFLGRDPAAEGINHERIDTLFDPARSKVNSADTYRLVPGIERIERLFGSRENGWLFKSGDRPPGILRLLRGGGGG
jgi:hypothetical protein